MNAKLTYLIPAFFLGVITLATAAQNSFDKPAFYAAMSMNDTTLINERLKAVDELQNTEKNAYAGALLMKKAGLVKGASNKLNLFKAGRKKLEFAILKNNANTEFRFLRLMIQEHAPGALGYKNDLQEDSEFIKKNYKQLPPALQQVISNYSKTSGILNPADF
ncbi:MAG TPA: hypothetical protein VMT76_09250 [Puia sp.]|nr:hypothetical protein [Puia sp.]